MTAEITIPCVCPICHKTTEITVSLEQYNRYMFTSALIQDVFPEMDIHTRETIISGMCLSCQEEFFVEDEDCDGECDVCGDFDCPSNANYFAPSCDDDCDHCDDYDCPCNTNEDN